MQEKTNTAPQTTTATREFTRVLITGASRGLGLALAKRFRTNGATVVGIARGESALVESLAPIGAHALAADIATVDAEGLATRAVSIAGGPFDLFIHAASTLGPLSAAEDPMPRLAEHSGDGLRDVFEVNTLGPARLIRALHRSMRRDGGTIAVLSSDAAIGAYPGWGPYGASKLALDHLIRVWAEEEKQLRFLSIDPGEMNTAMHAAAMPDADRSTLAMPDEVAARIHTHLVTSSTVSTRWEAQK